MMSGVRHWYGFSLSLLTALMWGVLPVVLELLLDVLDVVTITWARFMFSALFVFLLLARKGNLPAVRSFATTIKLLVAIAIAALLGNFLLYLIGLDMLNPETTQVMIQLAPFILMFGSVLLYGERMGVLEWSGAVVLMVGLLLFFNIRLQILVSGMSSYSLGVFVMVLASVSWSVYGLLQKRLLRSMNSLQLTLLIYSGGALTLLFFISPVSLLALNGVQVLALLFCCVNMVLGYGAFTEAMHVWQAAKVSAVIALAPVITMLTMVLAVRLWPAIYSSSELNILSWVGALLVVAGSMLAALGKAKA
jgi:drug/metabolite transporter (DMT)-like permease